MDELKPCPFCGSADVDLQTYGNKRTHVVKCQNCLASTGYMMGGQQEAIDAWNKRAGKEEGL